jgi:ATP-dependent DNA helicase RecG
MSTLDNPVTSLGPLAKRNQKHLQSLGISTIKELLMYFPFRHEDFTRASSIAGAPVGEHLTIRAKVVRIGLRQTFRRRIRMVEAVLDDGTGRLTALWFNQPYLLKSFVVGETYRFAGKLSRSKLGLRLVNPLYESESRADSAYARPLVPVYPLKSGMSQHSMRRLMVMAQPFVRELIDPLPGDLVAAQGLLPLDRAVAGIHFPSHHGELKAARRRLWFDELLKIQLHVVKSRRLRLGRRAVAVPFDEASTKAFVDRLPFKLTDDQRVAAWEAIQDMNKPTPMHRLLDGDVGSGKTLVAAIAALNACRAGYQAAIMAPTEILASQHFETLKRVFADEPVSLALWTNSYRRSARLGDEISCSGKAEIEGLRGSIAEGEVGLVIGTHALIEEKMGFANLALAVIDEQHRFGVRVRQELCRKSGLPGVDPHLLSMTATPIPRTLAMTVFGDLDLSLIREKPKNRKPVVTRVVLPGRRDEAYSFAREQVESGRQAFIVCPAIEQSDSFGSASVGELFEELKGGPLRGLPIAFLHGRLSASEKEETMAKFLSREFMALVSTSVIEVGVDVPNATVMVIEGAERFGLAQLHQFRGRVGRDVHESFCFLIAESDSDEGLARLRAVASSQDGFELAEKDLAMRGAGELLGEAQSGFSQFGLSAFSDLELIKQARQVAEEILVDDPELKGHPLLKEMMVVPEGEVHLE